MGWRVRKLKPNRPFMEGDALRRFHIRRSLPPRHLRHGRRPTASEGIKDIYLLSGQKSPRSFHLGQRLPASRIHIPDDPLEHTRRVGHSLNSRVTKQRGRRL